MAKQQSTSVSPNVVDEIFLLYALVFGQEPPADFAARVRAKFGPLELSAVAARDPLRPAGAGSSVEMLEYKAAA